MKVAKIQSIIRTDKENSLGQVPVHIRIMKDGVKEEVATRCFIEQKYWNKKTESVSEKHHDFVNLNKQIMGIKGKVIEEQNRLMFAGTTTTSTGLVNGAMGSSNGVANLFTEVEDAVKTGKGLSKEKVSKKTFTNYTKILNRLDKYYLTLNKKNESKGLRFADVTPDWLDEYHTALKDERNKQGEPLSPNYINGIFRMVRTFMNIGIARQVITVNPFDVFKVPSGKKTEKAHLSIAEIDEFEKVLPKLQGVQEASIIYFLFGCYSGLRVSDWYKFDRNEHLRPYGVQLETTKTETPMFVPYHDRLKRILKLMKDVEIPSSDILINREIKNVAAEIGIKKHLTTHCGRKTFAVTLCADKGITCEVCATMMGITVQVCMDNYYRVTMDRVKDETKEHWKDFK